MALTEYFHARAVHGNVVAVLFTALLLFRPALVPAAENKPSWQIDWDKTVKAAESEGEVNVYVVDYPRFAVSQFQKAFPKIKLNMIDGPERPGAVVALDGRTARG